MRQSNLYTFIFVCITTIVSALILSSAYQFLRQKQLYNERLEKQKNILTALKLVKPGQKIVDQKIQDIYKNQVKSFVVNIKGKKVQTKVAEKIDLERQANQKPKERLYPVYIFEKNEQVEAYCIPVFGKGLWSTIYGYLALEKDLNTVRGITFYKQGETPGLGAEVAARWFQENFEGKKIFNEQNKLVSITVVKGKLSQQTTGTEHKVDGISGATMTGNGVTKFLAKMLRAYEPFIRDQRQAWLRKQNNPKIKKQGENNGP
jgi:Na+-transporting NADH:ubiquinone oxidoreductase subunit C